MRILKPALAGAALLTLSVPALASAQPYYGGDYGYRTYSYSGDYGRNGDDWRWRRHDGDSWRYREFYRRHHHHHVYGYGSSYGYPYWR